MKTMLRTISGFLMLVLTTSASITPALAAEGGEGKAGLPQLDVTLFPAQLFWLAVTFVTLYILMAYVALPGVKRTLDRRGNVLSGDLGAAEAANSSAKAMIAQYEKALTDARAKAQATVSDISVAAGREAAARQAEQQRALAKRLAEAEGKIATARDAAIKNLDAAALELSAGIVEKVSGLKGVRHG